MKSSVTDRNVTITLKLLIKNYMTRFKVLRMPQCNFRYFVVEGKRKPDDLFHIIIQFNSIIQFNYLLFMC
jgi:hypothetical protein